MSIFSFSDYRAYLREYIATLPKRGRGEINRLGEALSVHPTLVSQVLSGQKDFSIEQAFRVAAYLGLQTIEADYFILLVQSERAGTKELKDYYKSKLAEIRTTSAKVSSRIVKHKVLTDYERSIFYSSWIYSAVWLFCSVDDGQTVNSVAEKFEKTRAEAAEILNFLKTAELCLEEGGVYKMYIQNTHIESRSPLFKSHHTNWRLKSIEYCESIKPEELMFTSPFSVSREDFESIREEIMQLIKSTSKKIKDSPAQEIACLNLDLFWIKK